MTVDKPVDPAVTTLFQTMSERGHRKADLARLLDLDSSQVRRIEKGERKIQHHEWSRIDEWLSVSLGQSVREAAEVAIMPGLVPLYGGVGASPDDRVTFAEQSLLGAVPRHPNQANVRGAFALRVHDESMSPRYEPGEIVYLAPNQWPAREQDCVVVTNDGFGFLKRFVRRLEGEMVCRQLNPAKDLTWDMSTLSAVHAVVGRG